MLILAQHGPSVPLLPDSDRHVGWLGSLMSVPIVLSLLLLAMRANTLPYLFLLASEPSFPSRATRPGPVVTFFGSEVARLTSPQLRGLVLHAADRAMVPLPLWTSCLLGSFGSVGPWGLMKEG